MRNPSSVVPVLLSAALIACGAQSPARELGRPTEEQLGAQLTWQEFLKVVYREPRSGMYIVDGDTLLQNEKQLREFYDRNVASGQLIIDRRDGVDSRWPGSVQRHLTYCVSDAFGPNKEKVEKAMADATGAWEAAADVRFVRVQGEDHRCGDLNTNVLFDVGPVDAQGQYLARAFFPTTSREGREVLIDGSAFSVEAPLSLTGILRHELGHTLGFRHEHTRPESGGACFEDREWRELTPYDSSSVMHYPQCDGTGDWSLVLTASDKAGARQVYGAPEGGPLEEENEPPVGNPITVERFAGAVEIHSTKPVATLDVSPGTELRVSMTGAGDPDLYVRFGGAPSVSQYDCRPYLDGAKEECRLNVPAGAKQAYVAVVGYLDGRYELSVEYVRPGPAPVPSPSPSGERTRTFEGAVTQAQQVQLEPLTVVPGTELLVEMSGTGDPDLYVRFGDRPSLASGTYACRPFRKGPSERCALTVPAGETTAYVMAYGYQPGTYRVAVTYTSP